MREYYKRSEIKEEIKLINIEGVKYDYVTRSGVVYKYMRSKDVFLKRKLQLSKHNGYVYSTLDFEGGNKNRRVHRLVALTFIDNPKNLKIVGHKNNIKHDNREENLYWTTTQENTQKAYDDGLAKNDIGIQDSQSTPIACYTNDHELVSVYGSISEAGRCIEGSTKSSIAKVVDKTTKGRKGYYYKSITKDEYIESLCKKNLRFTMPKMVKKRRSFKATSPSGVVYFSDNQKAFAREHDLKQANISHQIRKPSGGYYNDWYFEEVK